jgi:hypothetical protein
VEEKMFLLFVLKAKKLVNQDISLHAGMNGYREFAANLK